VTPPKKTVLCLASYEKGHAFLQQCHELGWRTLLLTSLSLRETAKWPANTLDDIFYMPDVAKKWDIAETIRAVSHLARKEQIDRIVPLDDFDLETASALREHLRVPGMGDTTTRHFRDKLAMRVRASADGVPIPEFVHTLNDARIAEFTERVPPPWVLKPRFLAGALGIKKVRDAADLADKLAILGDERSFYLLERFVPGDVFHVDSIVYENKMLFTIASGYGKPPLAVAQGGDVFSSRILPRESKLANDLLAMTARVLKAMRLLRGVSHTELIRGHEDGVLYFLETAARVGGAHLADMIEAASGINLWREWAKIEVAGGDEPYAVMPSRQDYAGLLVSLARQEHPDTSAYTDPEIVWRLDKKSHVGLIVRSPRQDRVEELLTSYVERVLRDFHAAVPPPDRPG
jgi:biotin carboxylase